MVISLNSFMGLLRGFTWIDRTGLLANFYAKDGNVRIFDILIYHILYILSIVLSLFLGKNMLKYHRIYFIYVFRKARDSRI